MAKRKEIALSKKERLFQNYLKKKLKQENRAGLLESLSKSCLPIGATGYSSFKTGYTEKKQSAKTCPFEPTSSAEEEEEEEEDYEEKAADSSQDSSNEETEEAPVVLPVVLVESEKVHDAAPLVNNPFVFHTFYEPLPRCVSLELPIAAEEPQFMDMIRSYPIVIVQGTTGCGKTTQIPQYLYAYGYAKSGLIGVTEPRRLAAMNTALRVTEETGCADLVSYQVRHASTRTDATRILFMTEGILLREIQSDFLLSAYSAIVLDEVHERHLNTDLLLVLLTRIVALREKEFLKTGTFPLRLVIMSAHISKDLEALYNRQHYPSMLYVPDRTGEEEEPTPFPPVLDIPSRLYDVSLHYEKATPTDFLAAAYKKIRKIHKRLPFSENSGNILVFVPGKKDVWEIINRLGKDRCLAADCDESDSETEYASDVDSDSSDDDSEHGVDNDMSSLFALPLYSNLPFEQQQLALHPQKTLQGKKGRLVIVATNVAETSITIPGISYIVDTGKVKVKSTVDGIESYSVAWISQASADQRSGRAGRTGPGHCYRLYSRAVYHELFHEETSPEITRTSLESLVLYLKSFHLAEPASLPFPTRPDPMLLASAERELLLLGLLQIQGTSTSITSMGTEALLFPVSPRYAKMMVLAARHSFFDAVALLVSALSIGQICSSSLRPYQPEGYSYSDLVCLLNIMHLARQNKLEVDASLNMKSIQQALQLYKQLQKSPETTFPSVQTCLHVLQIFLSCNPSRIACRRNKKSFATLCLSKTSEALLINGSNSKLLQYPISTWYSEAEEMAEISKSSSVGSGRFEYVMYDTITRNDNGKLKLNMVSVIEPAWIRKYGAIVCKDDQLPL